MMKQKTFVAAALSMLVLSAGGAAFCQPPARGTDGPQNGPPRGGRVSLLQAALDTNKDGSLSPDEISVAPVVLKTLDKNADGKITADEMRPKPMPVVVPPSEMVARLLEFDRNNDGKISRGELPERMKAFFVQADTNRDGIVNQTELTAISVKHEAARQEAERKAQALAPPPLARPEGRGGGEGGPPRLPPLNAALDTNKDGEISAEEIAASTATLKTLDQDRDGTISAEEMRPVRPPDSPPVEKP